MKATLLIKNIKKIYTCDKDYTVFSNAFIAMHHDKIIDLGEHDYKKWLDPATRVIDASNEIVVPAFIDCDFRSFHRTHLGDQLREDGSVLFSMRQNGILTLLSKQRHVQRQELTQDVFIKKQDSDVPIISLSQEYVSKDLFMLSCGFAKQDRYVYSLQPLAFTLYNENQVKSDVLLRSMTSIPASVYQLHDRGSLEVGKRADCLVLQIPELDMYFKTLGKPLIHRMVKNGIQFYPEWIVC